MILHSDAFYHSIIIIRGFLVTLISYNVHIYGCSYMDGRLFPFLQFLNYFIFLSPLKHVYGVGYAIILIMQRLKSLFLLCKYFSS